MDEQKIEKWVKQLTTMSYRRRLEYLPRGFYNELNDREKGEVLRRYKDQARKFPPRYETKGDRCK
jgi:hypothetical protein